MTPAPPNTFSIRESVKSRVYAAAPILSKRSSRGEQADQARLAGLRGKQKTTKKGYFRYLNMKRIGSEVLRLRFRFRSNVSLYIRQATGEPSVESDGSETSPLRSPEIGG